MKESNIWTGERLETFIYNENTVEHLHRYAVALGFAKNKVVLDIASGEGYGSNLLSKSAVKVYGVDIDKETVDAAKEKYKAANLEFRTGSADAIPLDTESVDVVVSFETLEHHDKHDEMMKEVKRVLKPGGVFIISTPDKKHYSDEKNYVNPFHVKELYLAEFKELIKDHFANAQFYMQNMFKGSLLLPEDNDGNFNYFKGDFGSIDLAARFLPMYVIAIASDSDLGKDHFGSAFASEIVELKTQADTNKKYREDGANWIKKSWSYRIGSFILSPFRLFRK